MEVARLNAAVVQNLAGVFVLRQRVFRRCQFAFTEIVAGNAGDFLAQRQIERRLCAV